MRHRLYHLHVCVFYVFAVVILLPKNQSIFRSEVVGEELRFCIRLENQCSRSGFQCKYICSFGLDVEQLPSLSPPRFAGGEQVSKLVRTLLVYSNKYVRMPALHFSAAFRSSVVPTASTFCLTTVSSASLSYGCEDFRSRSFRCGIQCSAQSLIAVLVLVAAILASGTAVREKVLNVSSM